MRNLKKVLALVLVFALMLSTVVVASAASFPDVDATYQYSEAVDLLASLNILGGYEDGTFKPENNITRAEFSKVLYVVFNGMDDVSGSMFKGTSAFKDVARDAWFNGNVNWASENAIVGGYGDGTFLPNSNVAIKEAIKMVVTCVTDKALTYPNGYIQEAKAQKLLDDLNFTSVDVPATRGQVAQIVYNLLYTRCRLCLRATGQYNTDAQGNNVEVYEKVAPIVAVFDLNAIGGTEEDAKDVKLVSTFENNWMGNAPTTEEGKITLSIDGATKQYDFDKDVNDLFGQKLIAYTNSKDELVSLISVSEVMTTTLDKCSGGQKNALALKVGEYNTDNNGKERYYTLDSVYTQSANGLYSALASDCTVKDGNTTKQAVKLTSVFADNGYNASNPVTFIDYDADGTYETMVVDYAGAAQVTRCTTSSKTISLAGRSVSFDNAKGYEAFTSLDYSDEKNPVYATYTVKQNGNGTTVYTLAVAKTAEGLLTSVQSPENLKATVGGTEYKAVGVDAATKISTTLGVSTVSVFDSIKNNTDETVKLYLNDAGLVVGAIVSDPTSSYDLNLAKIIDAKDDADKWGNNVVATLTVVLPDGTQKVLTLDTTIDAKTSDSTQVKMEGKLANFVSTYYKPETATATVGQNEVFFKYDETEGNYAIIGQYIHFEIDDDTDQVVRLVAADEIASYQPTNSSNTYAVTTYNKDLCHDSDNGFFVGDKNKVRNFFPTTDGFVGMYYDENEDGEIESFYYTASNIPTFYNEGQYILINNADGIVAMIVTESPDATAAEKVLGIITGFNRVSGESQKNNKNTYRIAINMWVNGENKTFYTEDAVASAVPNTDWDATALTGLTTNRLVALQLKTNGKVNVNNGQIDVNYIKNSDLTKAYATGLFGKNVSLTNVSDYKNAVQSGWSTNPETGVMEYHEEGSVGTVTDANSTAIQISDETTIITIEGTPLDIKDEDGLFQEVTAAKLSAGGQVEKSNKTQGLYSIFAYDVFEDGEAEDSDNDGTFKTLILFTTPIDAPVID